MEHQISIVSGFEQKDTAKVTDMYWEAFSEKFTKIVSKEKAKKLIFEQLDSDFALSAYTDARNLVGVAGYKTNDGCLLDFSFSSLVDLYGYFGASWRGLLLSLLERKIESEVLLMDGIFVNQDMRGLGIGTKLLKAIETEARKQEKKQIRLDVIDKNASAKKLYERCGFKVVNVHSTGIFKHIFGFSKAFEMRKNVELN